MIGDKVFRITHIDNIPHILRNGITHKDSLNANPNYITIGDSSLIDTRNSKNKKVSNGDVICVGDFIPFYFGVRMPMLYIIQNGYNDVTKRDAEEIIYLECLVADIINNNPKVYFSDGHARSKLSLLYDKAKLVDLQNILDEISIRATFWNGEENRDLKRKKEAEFLVKGDIAPGLIAGYGCYNEAAKCKLINFGIDESKVKIVPQAYY